MALGPNHSLVGQGIRLGFVVFIVIHVLISAWLVIDFKANTGNPTNKINAIAVVDSQETIIDVKMEILLFILYMLYRDYDSSYGLNETTEDDNCTTDEEQNDDTKDSSSSDSETDWLKFVETRLAFMILLFASEILMFFSEIGLRYVLMLVWISFLLYCSNAN